MTVQNLSLCLFVITTGCHEGRVKACSQHMIGTELDSCHQYGSPWSIGIAKAIFTGWMLLLTTSISDRALVGSVNTLYWKLCKCIWSGDWLSLIWAHFESEMSDWMWCDMSATENTKIQLKFAMVNSQLVLHYDNGSLCVFVHCMHVWIVLCHVAASNWNSSAVDAAGVWLLSSRQTIRDGWQRVDEEGQDDDVSEPAQDDAAFYQGTVSGLQLRCCTKLDEMLRCCFVTVHC